MQKLLICCILVGGALAQTSFYAGNGQTGQGVHPRFEKQRLERERIDKEQAETRSKPNQEFDLTPIKNLNRYHDDDSIPNIVSSLFDIDNSYDGSSNFDPDCPCRYQKPMSQRMNFPSRRRPWVQPYLY